MTTDNIQEKYGGRKASEAINNGPVIFSMSVEGLDATGKSRFGLATAPTPIVHINFGDRDPTPLLYDLSPRRRDQIMLYEFQAASPDGWTREEARQSLAGLAAIAKDHLADRQLCNGTFILDSGSTWWSAIQEVYVAPEQEKREMAKAANPEKGKMVGGLEYTHANLIVSGVLNWIKAQGAFLIITHTKSQEWGKNGPIPGKYRAQLNNRVPYIVEVRIDLTKECSQCGSPDCMGHVGRRHFGQFIKFGRDTQLEGMRFEDPSFKTVYALYAKSAFPDEEALE